jgi:hydroxymethylglutaryl-CoA reductase
MSSRIPGFYRLHPTERLSQVGLRTGISATDIQAFTQDALKLDVADLMIENVIGTFGLPLGIGVNFVINDREIMIPMVVEEPSVVAAVSNMAKLTRQCGGFTAKAESSIMIGQIQLMPCGNTEATAQAIRDATPELLKIGVGVHPRLEERGGGLKAIEVRTVDYDEPGEHPESWVVVHLLVDCVDAMGANIVNTLAERLAPYIQRISGVRVGLKILSNLADKRIATASVRIPPHLLNQESVDGTEVAQRIAAAYRFAWADPYRAATHNKGIMNGIDPVAIATGNDWRAIEAGAHAYASRDGQYRCLSSWKVDREGALCGSISLPVQVGVVGGPIKVHPTVQSNIKLMGISTARELAEVVAAVGLAQNLGALKALATEGIQKGHMRMHAKSVAATAGAIPENVIEVARLLCEANDFSITKAKAILVELEKAKIGTSADSE